MSIPIPRVEDTFEQRYELLEILGSGGIGTVFKARQIDANRLIALKILHAEIKDENEFAARFLREAQSLNKLQHPNIVTLYHFGISEDGLPYIAMELIHGSTLREIISKENKLSVPRAIHITKQLCSALAAMHEEGIVHRDLKPENIVLMNDPEIDFVKIIDFGLVHVEGQSDKQKLTATGYLLGSVNYMSPEQCRGLKVDARSDVYALGICFFEMLTGKCPFNSDSPVGVMYKHNSESVPPIDRTTVNSYHPSINEFIRRSTEKKPEQRFQTAEEMSQALDLLSDTTSGASPEAWHENRLFRTTLAAALTLILFVTGASYLKSQNQTKAAYVQAEGKALPLYKAKGHIDVGSLPASELKKILDDPKKPLWMRASAENRYSYINRANENGIKAARDALEMLSKMGEKSASQYKETSQVALAEALVCNKKYAEAAPLLDELLPASHLSKTKQNYLKLRALHSMVCSASNKNKEALEDLKELREWQYGLAHPSSLYALSTSLALKETSLARHFCAQSTKLSDAIEMSVLCRKNGHPELAEKCVEHARSFATDISLLNVQLTSKHQMTLAALLEIEEAWVSLYHHDKKGAKQRLEDLLSQKEMKALIDDNAETKDSIAELMQRLK